MKCRLVELMLSCIIYLVYFGKNTYTSLCWFNPESKWDYLLIYISDHITQIHKALFIYHMQFFQKVLVSTMCWCNSIFWKFQSLLFVSIFIHYDVKNCPVCSVGMFYTILFTWEFFKNDQFSAQQMTKT